MQSLELHPRHTGKVMGRAAAVVVHGQAGVSLCQHRDQDFSRHPAGEHVRASFGIFPVRVRLDEEASPCLEFFDHTLVDIPARQINGSVLFGRHLQPGSKQVAQTVAVSFDISGQGSVNGHRYRADALDALVVSSRVEDVDEVGHIRAAEHRPDPALFKKPSAEAGIEVVSICPDALFIDAHRLAFQALQHAVDAETDIAVRVDDAVVCLGSVGIGCGLLGEVDGALTGSIKTVEALDELARSRGGGGGVGLAPANRSTIRKSTGSPP